MKRTNLKERMRAATRTVLLMAIAAACSNENILPEGKPQEGKPMSITARMGSQDAQPQTRISHESEEEGELPGVIVKWTEGDAFRLYPDAGDASVFTITDGSSIKDEGKTATFVGNVADGASDSANALYPADAADESTVWTDITLSLDGQTQTGSDSYAHTVKYDYMTATAEDVENLPQGNDLAFHHLLAMMTIKITGKPDGYTAGDDNAPVQLTLSAGSNESANEYGNFYTGIKPSDGSKTSGTAALTLKDITWEGKGFTAHMMIVPTDLTDKTFTVSVRCEDGSVYRFTTPWIGKEYQKGMRYTATITGNGWKKADADAATVFDNSTSAAANFASGEGTADNPYIIATAGELKYFVAQANKSAGTYADKYIRLATDIKVTDDANWTPIGNATQFKGHFDGNGHTIYGKLNNSGVGNFGFFGNINSGSVKNLHIKADIIGSNSIGEVCTGGIAGKVTSATISDCSYDGIITGRIGSQACYTGGVAGYMSSGTISNCIVQGEISGSTPSSGSYASYTGGITGYSDKNNIQLCTNKAKVKGSSGSGTNGSSSTGGIIGYCKIGTIEGCNNEGEITTQYTNSGGNCHVGGLAGTAASSTLFFTNCKNAGKVTGGEVSDTNTSSCGGLIGNLTSGTLHQCLNASSAEVTGGKGGTTIRTGGLAGYNNASTGIIHSCCTNYAKVDGKDASDDNRTGRGDITDCDEGHEPRKDEK